MPNTNGKAYGMNALTPMPWWTTPLLRIVFWLAGHGFPPKTQQNFLALTFIHFARWTIVRRDQFPHLAPSQPREKLAYAYLLFISNFNGSWDQYIEAFSLTIPEGMSNIWRFSKGFPGPRPIGPFVAYIHRQQVDTDYYYAAYPGASAKDILGARHLQDALTTLAAGAERQSPEAFLSAFRDTLAVVQQDLSTTGHTPVLDRTTRPAPTR